jgi:hypothetical protein
MTHPDYRALCAELLNEIGHESPTTCLARAALAQPEPVAPTDEGLKAAYWEAFKNAAACGAEESWLAGLRAVARFAQPTLTQPEPVGLTDEELERRFRIWWHEEGSGLPPLPGMDHEEHVRRISQIAWHNGAYIARFAHPTLTPIPVSERPWEREGFLDAHGTCWMWHPINFHYCLCRPDPSVHTHSLPANALPLPAAPGEGE